MTEGVSLEGESRYACTYQTRLTQSIAEEVLFEALIHVDADELQIAIQTLEADKQSQFLPKLDNGV
jgi:hypothetical protein